MAIKVQGWNFDCHECDETLQKERGCEAPGIVPFYIEDDKYFRCPLKLITPVSWEYIKGFSLYDKGILPNGFGWINESQKFLDAMVIIENEMARMELEAAKKGNPKHG